MELSALIDEFKGTVLPIEKAYNNFKKDSKARKTASYKKKKLNDALLLWNELSLTITEIDALLIAAPDPCFIADKAAITALYREYVAEINKIVGESEREDGEANNHLRKQNVRFETLRKAIEEVESKISGDENMTISYCKMKLRAISDYWERIQIANEEVEFDRRSLPAIYEEQMDEYETSVDKVVLFLQEKLDATVHEEKSENLKLPRVQIPKFSGDYFKWISFRDLFTTMVINNKTLSDGQRMQVLKTNVGSEAEALISDLTIADVNFTSAWQRLIDRYDNNRVVVYKHLNRLMSQPTGATDAKSVKKILDTTDQMLMALKNLGRPIQHWDDWIIFIVTHRLSDECRKDWEKKVGTTTNLPTWDQLKKFLEEEFRMLEGLENVHKRQEKKQSDKPNKPEVVKSYQTSVETEQCPACEGDHQLFSCPKFKGMEVKLRWELAKKQKLCFACLKHHGDKLSCDKKKPCKRCNKKHSTWLHEKRHEEKSKEKAEEISSSVGIITMEEGDELTNAFGAIAENKKQTLLATTLISTKDNFGRKVTLRALIDSGSQGSMITKNAAEALQLKSIPSSKYISSLGGNRAGNVNMVRLTFGPRFESTFNMKIDLYLLKTLTKMLPNQDLNTRKWTHLNGLTLADPTFNKVGPIDVLLGTDVMSEIMQSGLIKGTPGTPMAQKTTLGWIVSGRIDPRYAIPELKCLVSYQEDQNDLRKFWELEDLNPKRTLTVDEIKCEELYQNNHTRDSEGAFTVKIPFKEGHLGPERLGFSKGQCMARFLQLEKRFAKDEKLKNDYHKVIDEYISLGHMQEVTHLTEKDKLYYIPHHAVIKPDSLTTKMRVVFDASAKTSTGWSLNDCMYTGAKQQNDLMEILIKWRKFKIVFKADIEKMYRMINLDKDDQKYHTVVWRPDAAEAIREYQLTTVTFGTAAAPFIATRTLRQIAEDGKTQFPVAEQIIKEDFYVDDLISGSDNITDALTCKDELIEVLQKGKMSLRKWTSNSQEILNSLPQELTEKSLQKFDEEDTTKALGLQWNPKTDKFSFQISWVTNEGNVTKRKLLSEASKLFDPLGWLAPTVINAKLLMQEVWTSKTGWDEEVSQSIQEKWRQFKTELPLLGQLSIDRWINYETKCNISLQGFCDVSEKAYAAAVYTRIQMGDQVEIKLITSKTRVAPINLKITLPRLELCGAVLLSQLLKTTKEALKCGNVPTTAWSDSMITLSWLKGAPNKWKTFVANRVAEIQATGISDWRYVKSEENPADCASRGIMPGELENHSLWWTGPKWLKEDPNSWETVSVTENNSDEQRIVVNVATVERQAFLSEASSWFKLVRVVAYMRRMKRKGPGGPLTFQELNEAKSILYKRCQQETFPHEIIQLQNNQPLSPKSRLLQLDPFLDQKGILRVGGRLQNSMMTYDNKHPIILPQDHPTTKLIIHQMHLDTLHGGPQLMLTLLQKKYWILQAKRMATNEFKGCVTCRRYKGAISSQLMGSLPKERVTLERAFLHVGVDYAGPIETRSSRLRNAKIQKSYIAIFVCFGTKAIHLELVSDMTTPAFMAALNRFIARRGLCEKIYSDNGTNFVGTSNKLERLEKNWLNEKNHELALLLVNKGIEWKFIPPGSPNFGGLWERGVKSIKDHLKKTLKTSRLTFEELQTTLCMIEACVNSRPLCPLTNDTENLNVLTPGHFLIGDALLAAPQPTLIDNLANKVDRWKYLQLLQQHFWQRWNREYLNQLQCRQKWKVGQENLQKEDLVLIKDERFPPRNWLMGRITEIHPGTDGRVRVVTLRTQNGFIKRSVNKLCPLLKKSESDKTQISQEEEETLENEQEIESHDLGPEVRDSHRNTIETEVVRRSNRRKQHVEPQLRDTRSTTHRWRPRLSTTMMIIALFGYMILMSGASEMSRMSEKAIRINKFNNNAGIYVEDLGRANVVKTEWHMYIRFGLQKYFTEFRRLQITVVNLKGLCIGLDSDMVESHCEDIVEILMHNVEEIKKLNVLITSNGDEMNNTKLEYIRTKRAAPLNIVGWIQHELFGVMAADQADHIEEQFELAQQKEDHVLKLIKNQTSIIENTVHLMKRSQDDINRNYRKIDDTIRSISIETNRAKRKINLIALSLATATLVDRFEKTQKNILDMIMDIHQGEISSSIFTPQQFKEQLEIINNNLPEGCIIPERMQYDFRSLYKVIKGNARVTSRNIILDINIPLTSIVEYQILHLIPIPTTHNGDHITIIPESEYLFMTLKKDNFYQVSDQEFYTCLRLHPEKYMCNMGHPLYNLQSNKSQCERELLVRAGELNASCKFIITKEKDFWIPLKRKNKWLFGVKNKLTLNVVCEKEVQSSTIQGYGVLEILPGCEGMIPGITLIAESLKQSESQADFYPTFNLSEAVIKSNYKIPMLNLTLDHSEQMNSIYEQLNELHKQSTFATIHHSLHYGWTIGSLVIIVVILLLAWKYQKTILKKLSTWYSATIEENNDVEYGHKRQDGGQKIHHSSSDDIRNQEFKSSTVVRHDAGECPFRT